MTGSINPSKIIHQTKDPYHHKQDPSQTNPPSQSPPPYPPPLPSYSTYPTPAAAGTTRTSPLETTGSNLSGLSLWPKHTLALPETVLNTLRVVEWKWLLGMPGVGPLGFHGAGLG
ncbi:hypothetical protein GX48_02214 [Paracoccidioides brasiliensis]|nr:hypothetical protein GX48_02214 [Paracoccidioides brasiliensis]